jgi:hypothetical protein
MGNWTTSNAPKTTEAERLQKENAELRFMLDRANAEVQRLKECIIRMSLERMGVIR